MKGQTPIATLITVALAFLGLGGAGFWNFTSADKELARDISEIDTKVQVLSRDYELTVKQINNKLDMLIQQKAPLTPLQTKLSTSSPP